MRTKEAVQTRIRELCQEQELSINRLSVQCGITQSTLNNIMSGRNNSTTVSTLQRICEGLGIELADFFASNLFRNLEQEIY